MPFQQHTFHFKKMSLKTLNSIHHHHHPSLSSSSLSSMKLKTLLQTFIFSHMYNIASKAKSLLIHLLKNIHFMKKNKHKKVFFGSFRLHYNWCSSKYSHPIQTCPNSHFVPTMQVDSSCDLSKYLQWLEDKGDQNSINEIDKLADLFIANSHHNFILEKQESYRMFQEMMARSI